jgi:hypothetical protein
VPKLAKHLDSGERKIFVRVKLHSLSLHKPFLALLILADGGLDLYYVRGGVSESSVQIRGSQGWVKAKNVFVRRTKLTISHEAPDRDTGIPNTSISAATIRLLGNPTRRCGHSLISPNVW